MYLLDKVYSFVIPYCQPVFQLGKGNILYTQAH